MSTAAFLLCPGRGSYGKGELGELARLVAAAGPEGDELVARIEAERRRHDPESTALLELDGAEAFRPGLHLPGHHAAPLIFACTLVDALRARAETQPVLAGGNSLGFYSALVVAGALDVESGTRLIVTMARLQGEAAGGQVLWTLIDDDWDLLPERTRTLDRVIEAVRAGGGRAEVSIRLGGHVVVAGDEAGVAALLDALPPVRLGKRDFPFRLPFHGPFHTALCSDVARSAGRVLGDLRIGRPRIPLVDGRGFVWSPLATEPAALLDYTLAAQVTTTFDFTAAVRVGLLEYAPDRVELLAPGSSLRAPVGHVERWLS